MQTFTCQNCHEHEDQDTKINWKANIGDRRCIKSFYTMMFSSSKSYYQIICEILIWLLYIIFRRCPLLNLNYLVGWKLVCLTLCWYPHQKYKICTYPYAINWAWFVKRRLHDDEDVIFVVIGFQILVCFHHSMIDILSRLFSTMCLVWWPIKVLSCCFISLEKLFHIPT